MKRLHRSSGLSFPEMLVVMALMTLLGAVLVNLVRLGYSSQNEIMVQNANIAAARQALDTVLDSLRGGTLSAASASDLTFTYKDVAGNSHTRRYYLQDDPAVSGTKVLMCTTDGSSATVINGLKTISFQYQTWDGSTWSGATAAPATPSQVGFVQMMAQVVIQPGNQTRSISGYVRLRLIR